MAVREQPVDEVQAGGVPRASRISAAALLLAGSVLLSRVLGYGREALLAALWDHATGDEFTWYQQWRVGDLILWDNRCVMHRRAAFDPETRRIMHRTQIKGDRPH